MELLDFRKNNNPAVAAITLLAAIIFFAVALSTLNDWVKLGVIVATLGVSGTILGKLAKQEHHYGFIIVRGVSGFNQMKFIAKHYGELSKTIADFGLTLGFGVSKVTTALYETTPDETVPMEFTEETVPAMETFGNASKVIVAFSPALSFAASTSLTEILTLWLSLTSVATAVPFPIVWYCCTFSFPTVPLKGARTTVSASACCA